jgi:hypothetical protein
MRTMPGKGLVLGLVLVGAAGMSGWSGCGGPPGVSTADMLPDGQGTGDLSTDGDALADRVLDGDVADVCECAGQCNCPCNPPPSACNAPPPPPYVHGSLRPVVELGLQTAAGGPGVSSSDLTPFAGGPAFLSVAAKLDEVEAQINAELAAGATAGQLANPQPVTILRDQDRGVAEMMIFRGKPTSVALAYQHPGVAAADIGQPVQAYVTLGGDIGIAGNEVAVLDLANLDTPPKHVRVGVRPHRVVRHPSNLMFVLNRYSNYISVIDPNAVPDGAVDDHLSDGNTTPQCTAAGTCKNGIKAEYFVEDVAFEVNGNNFDNTTMWATNRWRNSLHKYAVRVLRNPQDNTRVDSLQVDKLAEYGDLCNNPGRIALDNNSGLRVNALYITCGQGGMVVRFDPSSNTATRTRVGGGGSALAGTGAAFAGPAVFAGGRLYVATGGVNRGQLTSEDAAGQPDLIKNLAPVVDEASGQVVHPGPLFDGSYRSRLEDLSSDIVTFAADNLAQDPALRFTDRLTAERSTTPGQRILDGTAPRALSSFVDPASGLPRLLAAFAGNSVVQELGVAPATGRLLPGTTFRLGGPTGLDGPLGVADVAIDASGQCLFTADSQSDTLTITSRDSCPLLAGSQPAGAPRQLDLGYAYPGGSAEFPATRAEQGELVFHSSVWSNNGQKTCSLGCHVDETLSGGGPFGVISVTPGGARLDRINPPPHAGHGFFATGGSWDPFPALAFFHDEFLRPHRDASPGQFYGVVETGLICGLGRTLDARTAAAQTPGADGGCGDPAIAANLPTVISTNNFVVQALSPRLTVSNSAEVYLLAQTYVLAQSRLFPNPGQQLWALGIHPDQARITAGQNLFGQAGANCAQCHRPQTGFRDGRRHGAQSDFIERFVDRYRNDSRLQGSLPQALLLAAASPSPADTDLAVIVPDLEATTFLIEASGPETTSFDAVGAYVTAPSPAGKVGFVRFDGRVLDDPPGTGQEPGRFDVIRELALESPDTAALPGQLYGVSSWETPTLRGVWDRQCFLHDGRAFSVKEAILRPGHPALNRFGAPGRYGETELGYAVTADGTTDAHGATSNLSADDVDALLAYVNTIE